MQTCRFFAQGRCAFGTACRLSHDLPGGGGGGGGGGAPRGAAQRQQEPLPPPPPLAGGGGGGGGPGAPWPPESEDWYFQDPAFGANGLHAAPGAAASSSSTSWGVGEVGAAASSSGAAPQEADAGAEMKEIRKMQKALREIAALEERLAAGEGLQGNQLKKIEKKEEYERKVRELEEAIGAQEVGLPRPPLPPPPPPSASSSFPAPFVDDAAAAAAPGAPVPRKAPPPPRPDWAAPAPAAAPSAPVCRHFLAGRCSFGDACRNSHFVDTPGGGASASGGSSPSAAAAAARAMLQRAKPEEPAFDAEDPECGICFESIKKKGERFGILESCDHAFCLTCIRSWRRQREQQDRQNLRLCPVCRNESYFVVPSDTIFLDPEEKGRVIEQYKLEMARIPCKLFDYGRGKCPFGTSCFYAHLNPDGTRFVPAPLRWRNGADGSEVVGEVKLSDFLTRSLALP